MMMLNDLPGNHPITVVFDTNVYIAAALRPGLSEELIERGIEGQFGFAISPAILLELEFKLRDKFNFDQKRIDQYVTRISQHAVLVTPSETINAVIRDPDDNRVLECALAAKASIIISLDKDLLDLKTWHGIAIVHPKSFSWIIPQ